MSTRAPHGYGATSPRPTRWRSTHDRPEPRAYGRRPDADLRRRPHHGGHRLLRRVRVAGHDTCSATRECDDVSGVRCTDERPILRVVWARFGAARACGPAAGRWGV